MTRQAILAALLLAACGGAAAAAIEVPLPTALDPKVESLLAPLSAMPSIQRADEVLRVEIEAGSAPDAKLVTAALTPSFGELRPRSELGLPLKVEQGAQSRLWPGRTVDVLEYALPHDLLPDLYDLEVSVAGFGLLSGLSGTDMQRRAVSIVAQYAKAPRVIVISDTHTGDPRDVVDVATDAIQRQEYMQVIEYIERTVGNPMNAERWKAFAQVIREINLVRPDFVIVTGDLTFLVHDAIAPLEYDDAWRLLDRLEVPAYVAPGNHDLYIVDDMIAPGVNAIDGVKLWHDYFGPLYYSANVGPDLHLTALNTFEWPKLDPFPVEDEFDTRAAAQISPEQFAWLQNDLHAARERSPKGTLVTFAHHDPSWMQRRHAWTGEYRLETRDLMAETNVGVHFSGHTHEDRVARYYKGDVVETNGRPHVDGHVVKQLHLLLRDGNLDTTHSQEELGAILRDPKNGPLFISTTTAASELVGDIWGLGGWWGWRLATLAPADDKGSLDAASFGYPATDEFIAAHAERPENWTAEHAQYGLFSYPSFELKQTRIDDSHIRIDSGLLADLPVTVKLSIAATDKTPLKAAGGEVKQLRYGNGLAEAWVSATVPARGGIDIRLDADVPKAAAVAKPASRFGGAMPLLFLGFVLPIAIARRSRKKCGSGTLFFPVRPPFSRGGSSCSRFGAVARHH